MSSPDPPPALDAAAVFHKLLELGQSLLVILAPDGTVLEINRATLRLGLGRDAFIGRHIGETPSFSSMPDAVRTWNTRMADAARWGEPQPYEDLFTGPDGEARSADAVLTPVLADHDGADSARRVEYFLLEADDTTDRVGVELALRDSERRFHDLAESLPVLAWSADAAGQADYFNERWLDYTGAAPGAHHGLAWTEAVHPDDRPVLAQTMGVEMAAGEPFLIEYRLRSRTGEYRWFEARGVPVCGPSGEVTRWYGTSADVHDQRELQRSLDEREAQLRAALEAGRMARFSYDLEARRFTADDYLSQIVRLPDEMHARDGLDGFLAFVHPADRVMWQQTMMRAFDPASPEWSLEYRIGAEGEEPTWIGARGVVTFSAGDKPRTITGVVFSLPGRRGDGPVRGSGVPDAPLSLSWPSRLDPRD